MPPVAPRVAGKCIGCSDLDGGAAMLPENDDTRPTRQGGKGATQRRTLGPPLHTGFGRTRENFKPMTLLAAAILRWAALVGSHAGPGRRHVKRGASPHFRMPFRSRRSLGLFDDSAVFRGHVQCVG